MRQRHLTERHQSSLAALAERRDHAPAGVHVAEFQVHQLTHAQASCVGETQHGAIPEPTERRWVRRLDEPQDLLGRQGARQAARRARAGGQCRGILRDDSLAGGETHQAAQADR